MIFPPIFPYMRPPFFANYNRFPRYYARTGSSHNVQTNSNMKKDSESECLKSSSESSEQISSPEYFEVFGIKLFFDDILILCLLYFLYKEDVNDPMLFIALLMLLLS